MVGLFCEIIHHYMSCIGRFVLVFVFFSNSVCKRLRLLNVYVCCFYSCFASLLTSFNLLFFDYYCLLFHLQYVLIYAFDEICLRMLRAFFVFLLFQKILLLLTSVLIRDLQLKILFEYLDIFLKREISMNL